MLYRSLGLIVNLPALGSLIAWGAEPRYARLTQSPLYFERNLGQAEATHEYLAHGDGYVVLLEPARATIAVTGSGTTSRARATTKLTFAGASKTRLEGLDLQGARVHY